MARKVDHEERKLEIAKRALHLFSQVGYENVSLIMIAASAGVSRTILYRYFCSKREVMDAAILTVTGRIEALCSEIMRRRQPVAQKLESVCHVVVDVMFENREFLVAVFDFVVGMVRSGVKVNASLADFTAGTRKVIQMLVAHGIKRGDIPDVLDVHRTTDAIYAEFESCAMRIVIGTEKDSAAAKVRLSDVIRAISCWK